MRVTRSFVSFVAFFAAVIGASILAAAADGQGGQVRTPQNIQVLPKDWTLQQIQTHMRSFTAALGVECLHCHVGTMADRPKDDNPKKAIARRMIEMTNTINNEMLKGVGSAPAANAAKVTCFTCHRGQLKPLAAPQIGAPRP